MCHEFSPICSRGVILDIVGTQMTVSPMLDFSSPAAKILCCDRKSGGPSSGLGSGGCRGVLSIWFLWSARILNCTTEPSTYDHNDCIAHTPHSPTRSNLLLTTSPFLHDPQPCMIPEPDFFDSFVFCVAPHV